ncbi:unnamed protein product, partial [Iphiclides podalirius]
MHLLSSKDEWVVCEAVVVVKRVVGGGASSARAAVSRAAKLLRSDRLAASARAAAVWLVAEHGAHHPRAAAVLAHMAATFPDQDELVKLQLLSLAVKLSITQPDTLAMCSYVISMARYDASYDVRDRTRLLRRFVDPKPGTVQHLRRYTTTIFCPDKPKPTIESSFKDRQQFTVGSLSQYIGSAATGYRPLPAAPRVAVASALRETAPTAQTATQTNDDGQKNKSFYSEPDSEGSGSGSSSTTSSSGSEESSDEEESNKEENEKRAEKTIKANNYRSSNSGTSDSDSDSSESSDSSDASSSESSDEEAKGNAEKESEPEPVAPRGGEKSNLELLLELDEVASSLPTMTPTCGGFLSPPTPGAPLNGQGDSITPVGPSAVATSGVELMSRVVCSGLGATRRWTRSPHLFSQRMCALEVTFTNTTASDVTNIRVNKKTLTGSRAIHEFAAIPSLAPGASAGGTLGVDFADSIQPIEFTIISSLGEVPVSITPSVGELMRAVTMSEARWDAEQKKLRGMTECDKKTGKLAEDSAICKRVFETANVAAVTATGSFLRFAGRLMSSQELVLVSVRVAADGGIVAANCANVAVASLLASEVASALAC